MAATVISRVSVSRILKPSTKQCLREFRSRAYGSMRQISICSHAERRCLVEYDQYGKRSRHDLFFLSNGPHESWFSIPKRPLGSRPFSSSGESELPAHNVLQMPALSPTMDQGNIANWKKNEGDKVEVGDVICDIETDKATLDLESMEEGYLAKILVPAGSKEVRVGQPLAIFVENPDDIPKFANGLVNQPSSGQVKKDKEVVQNLDGRPQPQVNRLGPSVRRLLTEFGLDGSLLKGTGPRGNLLKGDVLAAIKSGAGSSQKPSEISELQKPSWPSKDKKPIFQPTSAASLPSPLPPQSLGIHEDLPNSQIRKIIAKRLLESKHGTPHVYFSADVLLDPLLALRKELKEKHGLKISVNDIVIKAAALALKVVPEANAYWNDEKGESVLCDSIDISIAVATEKGLMTPILRNADQKSLSVISAEVKELADKARVGKLAPSEFQGGTFSISNLGMFPVDQFCAIINPPQACILAVGRGNRVVKWEEDPNGKGKAASVTQMNLTLSADHRVFDGHIGGRFLNILSSNFKDVKRLLL
eukprot:Gb_12386 [translate_table: standard]